MREQITSIRIQEIEAKVPTLVKYYKLAVYPSSFAVSANDFLGKQNWTGALACLNDADNRFMQTRSALIEAFASLAWFREESPDASNEAQAIDNSKFYVDYVALLLYATAEDIASFTIDFLGIENDMNLYFQNTANKRTNVSSNASKVGVYLHKKYPSNNITIILLSLHNDVNWKKSIEYRNTWVHDQPPVIRGTGIQHPRKAPRVNLDDGTERMYFGASVAPKYTIDELIEVMLQATRSLSQALSDLANIVIKERESLGEIFDIENMSINYTIPFREGTNTEDSGNNSAK